MKTDTCMTTTSAPLMEQHCINQPRRLIDFLQDQNLPFPHHRNHKSTISVILRAAVKSSSILRRRFSIKNRSSRSSRSPEPTFARTTSVTVKDILRWKSFGDLSNTVEINVPPSYDFTVESVTSTATTRSGGTPASSWSDSDFTVGDSPVWCRGFSGEKKLYISVAGAGDPKDQIAREAEYEQFSPISVLDFTQEHEQTFSSFHQTLANMERRNLMLKQRIQDFESLIAAEDLCLVNKNFKLNDTESFEIEEKAIQLMETISLAEDCNKNDEYLLLNLFRDELIWNKCVRNNEKLESRVLQVAKSWVSGEDDGYLDWELEGTREVCIREMEKRGKWNDFEEEKQEIVIAIEKLVLNHLLDELTMDFLNV